MQEEIDRLAFRLNGHRLLCHNQDIYIAAFKIEAPHSQRTMQVNPNQILSKHGLKLLTERPKLNANSRRNPIGQGHEMNPFFNFWKALAVGLIIEKWLAQRHRRIRRNRAGRHIVRIEEFDTAILHSMSL